MKGSQGQVACLPLCLTSVGLAIAEGQAIWLSAHAALESVCTGHTGAPSGLSCPGSGPVIVLVKRSIRLRDQGSRPAPTTLGSFLVEHNIREV